MDIQAGIHFLLKGGWVMWPMFLLATIALAVIIERAIMLKRAATDTEELIGKLKQLLHAGQTEEALRLCEAAPGPVAALLANGLRNRHLDNATIERAMEELALRETPELSKRLGILDTIITMAPLLGLLGTITGMIAAFDVVGTGDASQATKAITGGVAEALIATAAGLVIAIGTLPFYNYLSERVKEIISDMETRATQLLNILASVRDSEERKAERLVASVGK
jgi:biopolymer transport protein ExbB